MLGAGDRHCSRSCPRPRDVIADVGCGTGTQLRLVARACPSARLIGIDPDAAIRERARAKLAGQSVELLAGYARDAARLLGGRGVTKVLSSLVFIRCRSRRSAPA